MNQSSGPESNSPSPIAPLKPDSREISKVDRFLENRNKRSTEPNPEQVPESPPRGIQSVENWGLSTKVTLAAIAFSAVPLLIVGLILYGWGQSFKTDSNKPVVAEEVQQYSSNLALGAGGLALASGAIAAFLARRTSQSVVKAADTSNHLVDRLRNEKVAPRQKVTGEDELSVLTSNLQLLTKQLPNFRSSQEAESEQIQVLIDMTKHLREARSEEDVLRIAVTEVRQRFRTDRVTVFQFQENGEGTFVEEAIAQGWPKLLWSTIHDPSFAEGYIQKSQERDVWAVDDIYHANLDDHYIGLLEKFGVKANLIAPIIRNKKLFGLLIAHQCSAPRFWQPAEMDLFAQIAAQIGFSLDHARLFAEVDQRALRSQLFIDVTRRIRTSLNTEDVLKVTVNEVRKAIEADRVIVYGLDNQWYGTIIAESVLAGYPKALWANIKDPCFDEGYLPKYQAGRVQVINNIQTAGLTDCHLKQLEPFEIKANLVAPILKDNRLFGLLIAHQCSGPREWQSAEVDWFAQIAMQVGFAMDHARLLDQTNSESIQSKALADITRQIRSSLVETDVLKTTVTEVRRALQSDRVMVYSFDADWYGTVVAEAVLPSYPKALWAKIKDPCFTEGYVEQYLAGRVQAIANVEAANLTQCHLKQLEPFGVKANLVAPILKDDQLFGLLIAHQCSGPRDWLSSEVDLFAQIAAQVGFALDHARLLDQVEQAYQTAEGAFADQRHQRETLQSQLSELLTQSVPAVTMLSTEMMQQIESVTTIYQHMKILTTENQQSLTSLTQQTTQSQHAQELFQQGCALVMALHEHLATLTKGLAAAEQNIQQLSNPIRKLFEVTQFVNQITSQMKLQAMNAALEATRMGGSAQEFANIGEKVLDLARQLDTKTTDLNTITSGVEARVTVAIGALQGETQQLQSDLKLINQTEQTFAKILATHGELQSWLQSMAESLQRQSDASEKANQMILELASRSNQASETAIALSGTLSQLSALSHQGETV